MHQKKKNHFWLEEIKYISFEVFTSYLQRQTSLVLTKTGKENLVIFKISAVAMAGLKKSNVWNNSAGKAEMVLRIWSWTVWNLEENSTSNWNKAHVSLDGEANLLVLIDLKKLTKRTNFLLSKLENRTAISAWGQNPNSQQSSMDASYKAHPKEVTAVLEQWKLKSNKYELTSTTQVTLAYFKDGIFFWTERRVQNPWYNYIHCRSLSVSNHYKKNNTTSG